MIELDGLLSRSQIYAEEMIFNTKMVSAAAVGGANLDAMG